jgi:adenylate cyclase
LLISYETYANVKDEIACQEQGNINVRGIAYPVTTYRVVDLKANLEGKAEAIRADTPHLRIEVQPELMSVAEREQAATALRRILNCLVKP